MRTTEVPGRIKTWVVGRGGLVGSAVARRPELDVFESAPIPWHGEPGPVLEAELDRFVAWIGDDPWSLVWAAGAGVMATGQAVLDAELATFTRFCVRAAVTLPEVGGGIYLVSSAGGAYAGSSHPPFDVTTTPAPLNAYGRTKLAQEDAFRTAFGQRFQTTIGRLANVYGPGQDLTKLQGLVTQLSLNALLGRSALLFAPLTTLRDYIYVDDAARVVVDDVVRMAAPPDRADRDGAVALRVVCSGRSTSIAELISMVESCTGRSLPLVHLLPGEPYILDLRLRAARGHSVDRLLTIPLETGVSLVWQDLVERLAAGELVGLV
jgi:UDP-glucose 4-epimerase